MRGPNLGAVMPPSASSSQTRPRWPAYGSSSSSIRASVPRASPASAQATVFGMWKSPTLTASGSPYAVRTTSAAVHGPMPGMAVSRRVASALSAHRSSRAATRAHAQQRLGAALLDPERMEGPVRRRRHRLRIRRKQQPGRPRRGLAEVLHDRPVGPVRLDAGDLLLQDGPDQAVEEQAGGGEPYPREGFGQPRDQRMRAPRDRRNAVRSSRSPAKASARSTIHSAPGPCPVAVSSAPR